MSIRELTWKRWLELVTGAVLPTVFLVPPMIALGWAGWHFMGAVSLPVFMAIGGIGAVASLWLLILVGTERVAQRPRLSAAVVMCGGLGLAMGGLTLLYLLFAPQALAAPEMPTLEQIARADDRRWAFVALLGSTWVGFRYWVLLANAALERRR